MADALTLLLMASRQLDDLLCILLGLLGGGWGLLDLFLALRIKRGAILDRATSLNLDVLSL
jgi:hypothetical protein